MTGGHGHVTPRPDGLKARCGGPAICDACARELAALNAPKTSNDDIRAFVKQAFTHGPECPGSETWTERIDPVVGFIARVECTTCGAWFEGGGPTYGVKYHQCRSRRANRPDDTGGADGE